jgi:hypothetical protein
MFTTSYLMDNSQGILNMNDNNYKKNEIILNERKKSYESEEKNKLRLFFSSSI